MTNQTQSFLMRRFREVGIHPQSRHGQNFLIDLNLLRMLADSAQITRDDVVLEVGTGMGSLTALLSERAGAVLTVEVDPAMHQLASEELIDCENVTMLQQDALANKSTVSPVVMEAVRAKLAEGNGRRFKLAANLPYNIATPLLSNLLAGELVPATMTVTIQKELADRIVASPGSKDYSALSFWVQSQCDVEIVRLMPPSVFWPRPKVTSAIVHVVLNPEKRSRISDLAFFHEFVRAMFFHRRKLLRSVIASAFKDKLKKTDADAILAAMGLPESARAEELSVETMIALADACHAAGGELQEGKK